MKTFASLALLLTALPFTGCVSTKYKLTKAEETTQPIALNLPSTPAPLEATVSTVIVFQGPGSWKREAYWDEYVVTLANHGAVPLAIESATLVDFQSQPVVPGDDPWEIEKESRTLEARLASAGGTVFKIGGGLIATSAVGIYAGAALATAGSTAGTMGFGGGFAALGGAVVGVAIVVPVFTGATIYRNISNRHKVAAEFQRRRLTLPAKILPGQTITGSLFFRISPGPQTLALTWRSSNEPHRANIDLQPLAGLHLVAPAVPSVGVAVAR